MLRSSQNRSPSLRYPSTTLQFLLAYAVLRVQGRSQNPAPNPGTHQTPVETLSDVRRPLKTTFDMTQPAPKYHTKGCSHSSADSPGARTLVFAAFEPFHSCEFRPSIARTPFCAILWRSPNDHFDFGTGGCPL